MPACDHCGKVVGRVHENSNGRTLLRLCPLCQAEFELKQSGNLTLAELSRAEPWYRRWWRKLTGG
ncbi:MAG: hypothetical protein U0931_20260 [Vulcanimicrobiota bacterium]